MNLSLFASLSNCRLSISLPVTKQIVEQHGGTISVRSNGEGEGAVFTVRLPCIVGSDDGAEELFDIDEDADRKMKHSSTSRLLRASFLSSLNGIPPPSWMDASADALPQPLLPRSSPDEIRADDAVLEIEALKRLRVLVVDDSDTNRKMVCKVLTATKEFLCEQAVDGSVAVEMVQQQLRRRAAYADSFSSAEDDMSAIQNGAEADAGCYDVILMDYQMPVMDGPTAIAEIRKLGYSSVILGLTGNALLSDRDTMLKAGADGVLLKPMNVDLFRDTLKMLSTKK